VPLLTLLEYGSTMLFPPVWTASCVVLVLSPHLHSTYVTNKKQKKKNEKNPNFQDVHHEETALNCSFSDILIQCMMQSNSSTELVCTGQQYCTKILLLVREVGFSYDLFP